MKALSILIISALVVSAFSACRDQSDFSDADGDDCSYYAENPEACAYARENRRGEHPGEACCACGGGRELILQEFDLDLDFTFLPSSKCKDKDRFFDADGDSCAYYQNNKAACTTARANRQGVTPVQACCACGGGKTYVATTFLPSSGCKDKDNFFDADGDGCAYYENNRGACTTARANRLGVTPVQACCACGGGKAYLDTTFEASSKCKDRANFRDADGDSCGYYETNRGACTTARANRQGVTPAQACCACGGGKAYLDTTFLAECKDKANYRDADGDPCSYYETNPSACSTATANRQGVSPAQACCACGGGSSYLDTTFEASSGCTDKDNFRDADGDSCGYYETNRGACTTASANRQGVTPAQACCACGGGKAYLDTTFLAGCKDKANYRDADGDPCSYYETNPSACSTAAANRQGVSPAEACCACGGGSLE